MSPITIRDMQPEDEYFVSTCSHVNETEEIDACGRRRLVWMRAKRERGLVVKVALHEDRHAGFVYLLPIEESPWGPLGQGLGVIPCLWVLPDHGKHGIGAALMAAADEQARAAGYKALVTAAYEGDFWFMPATFFEHVGLTVVRERAKQVLMWKVYDAGAEPPEFLQSAYVFKPVPGKVAIDLFWSTFCQTSDLEAQRVREVAAEFGESVVLREFSADDPAALREHQTTRGIFIDGREISWGYEAPREGIREAIEKALATG